MVGSQQTYSEYKESGFKWLGKIPNHWVVSPIKWQIERVDGGAWGGEPKGEKDTIVLRSTEQTADGLWKMDDPAPRSLSAHEAATTLLLKNDLLMTKSSGSALHIGKTSIVTEEVASLCCGYSNFMQRIRIADGHSAKFYWYIFNNELARKQLDYLSNSTTGLANLNATMIGEVVGATPPKAEQQKIANFLDHETAKTDTLIEKQQQLIKLLKEKRQAVISHAVTKGLNPNPPMRDSGVEWLGDVPEGWNTIPLKLVVNTRKGVAFKSVDFCSKGIRVVKASDIKQKTIRATDVFLPKRFEHDHPKALLSAGDIILSTVGSNPEVKNSAVGQIGMVPINLNGTLLNQNTVVFDPQETLVRSEYLFYILQMQGYRDHLDLHAHGTANQSSLSITDMLNFNICFPNIEEQNEICNYLSSQQQKLGELESKSRKSEALLIERRTALISAAVTGKIDVRDWQAPESSDNETQEASS